MKKVVGYVISVVGLAVMSLGFGIFDIGWDFLDGISGTYVAGAGIILVVVGAVLSMKGTGGRKSKHASEEVPIYEGTGKKRKIVGYRKD